MKSLYIHPDNPQARLIDELAHTLKNDGLGIIPTDISYVFAVSLSSKNALERLKTIRKLGDKHHFSLLCRDLSQIANYANVNNEQYRELKAHTPSAITFVLNASKDTPKKFAHPKKKTIGIRVCDTSLIRNLLDTLKEPILTSSLILPDQELPLDEPYEIEDRLDNLVDVFVNVGTLTTHATTVVDMTSTSPALIIQGVVSVSDWVT